MKLCARRIRGWPIFLGAIALYPIPYYLTYSAVRFRHALEPLLLILIVYFGSEAWVALRQYWPVIEPELPAELAVAAAAETAS